MNYKKTDILSILKKKGYILIDGELDKSKNRITLKNKQGFKGIISLGKLIRGTQEVCYFSNKNPFVLDNIRLWLKINNPNLTLVSTAFVKSTDYLEFKCIYHGEYISSWQNVYSGYGCKKCAAEKISKYKRNDINEVIECFKSKGFEPLFTEYKNRNEKLIAVDKDGYKIHVSYASFKNSSPQIFSCKNKFTIDNIKLWLSKNLDYIELLEDKFVNAHSNMKTRCNKHNHVFHCTWNNLSKGKGCCYCKIEKTSGENNCNYNPNLTQEQRTLKRNYIGKESYCNWRKSVFNKDNHTCKCCGQTGGKLNAHHLDGWNWCEEKRIDIDNGITLCEKCHENFHKEYGKGNNTKEQFNEWFNNTYMAIQSQAAEVN